MPRTDMMNLFDVVVFVNLYTIFFFFLWGTGNKEPLTPTNNAASVLCDNVSRLFFPGFTSCNLQG